MKNINSNLSWSKQVVNLLYQKGVRYACISPGSRNSPLIYQFSNSSNIQCYSHLDERSGSFFDKLPGIGENKRIDLLNKFGSIEKIKRLNYDDLIKINGIGDKTAQRLIKYLSDVK